MIKVFSTTPVNPDDLPKWIRIRPDLTAEEADLARQQIAAGREFRAHVDAYWGACEEWADAQLADSSASSGEAKKGGSKRTSKTKPSGKSKRS